MKQLRIIGIICLWGVAIQFVSAQETLRIIKLGSEQAELLPRVLKNYAAIKMNMQFSNPQEKLTKGVQRLDSINRELIRLIEDPRGKALQQKANLFWEKGHAEALKRPTPEGLQRLKKHFFALFDNRVELIQLEQKIDGSDASMKVLILGKLSLLPQKFAGMYMLLKNTKGKDRDHVIEVLEKYVKMYEKAVNGIEKLDPQNPVIITMQKNLLFLKHVIQPDRVFTPALVFSKTNNMTEDAYKAMKME